MKMLKILRTEGFVRFVHEVAGPTIKANDPKNPGSTKDHQTMENRKVTAHEIPLKSFDKALQALADVACNILEVGAGYAKGITVLSLGISYTKSGVRSAIIVFNKTIDATGTAHRMQTPMFQIDDGATPDEGRKQCTKQHAAAVDKMIDEAVKYAAGERQQGTLKFEGSAGDDGSAEDDDNPPLPFPAEQTPAPEAPAPKKKRATKKTE